MCLLANLHTQLTFMQFSIPTFRMSDYTRTTSPSQNCTPDKTVRNMSPIKINSFSQYEDNAPSGFDTEVDEYFRITSQAEPWVVNPLECWYMCWAQFLHLYCFASNVLCIPGASLPVLILTCLSSI
jgi:hypothetical protein